MEVKTDAQSSYFNLRYLYLGHDSEEGFSCAFGQHDLPHAPYCITSSELEAIYQGIRRAGYFVARL